MVLTIPAVYDPVDMARRRSAHNRTEPEPGTLGAFIRQRRDAIGLTQQDLADRVVELGGKMAQGDISDLESNNVGLPRPPRMQYLSKALEVPLSALYSAAGYPDHAVPDDGSRPGIEAMTFGLDGEIIALVRRIPKRMRPQAIKILQTFVDDDSDD